MAVTHDTKRFIDRRDAGRRLAQLLAGQGIENPVVVGMARGGVPVAAEIARKLGAPLDLAIVRKVGAPFQPELAIGAIAEGDARAIDTTDARRLGLSDEAVEAVVERERRELERRVRLYREECPQIPVDGRNVILVDDGYATGHTAAAAAGSLHERGAKTIVLAVPVCPAEAVAAPPPPPIDRIVYLIAPRHMLAVGYWYDEFRQITDAEVLALIREARGSARPRVTSTPVGQDAARTQEESSSGVDPSTAEPWRTEVTIDADAGVRLQGTLAIPPAARGLVLFAHGSGSSRHSPRNRMVAEHLNEASIATLLFDLLDPVEAEDRRNVFDIALLAQRLRTAAAAMRETAGARGLPIGLFGASTGAAAALVAAASPEMRVRAVVSRGGRPDLAGRSLARVTAPTLLIVGGADTQVIELNKAAMREMHCHVELRIVPGAGHLFDGPGQLEEVAAQAASWFSKHFVEGDSDVRTGF